MKYIFDLGSNEANILAAKAALSILNTQYGYPNNMGTETYSDLALHPDGEKVAIDILNGGDQNLIQNGNLVTSLDSSWDEAKIVKP